jgi:17beta-estradiol 17-dehydrogenase / very-long-chain 3-oxoacyl-CoA reductase
MALLAYLISITGILTLTYALFQTANFLYIFLRPSRLHLYHHGPSPWACITGASDGIGLALAHELAANNFNLILHGRNPSKLAAVRASILATHPHLSIRIFLHDASSSASPLTIPSAVFTAPLNLTILINNLGLGYETPDPESLDAQINTNLRFATHLTHAALPILRAHTPALVLTMGSIADAGIPFLPVYSGSKAFLRSWSRSLAMQMRAERAAVEFLTLDMVEVSTPGNPQRVTALRPSARTWARAALRRVGYGESWVSGFWVHAVLRMVVEWMPRRVHEGIVLGEVGERRKTWGRSR